MIRIALLQMASHGNDQAVNPEMWNTGYDKKQGPGSVSTGGAISEVANA